MRALIAATLLIAASALSSCGGTASPSAAAATRDLRVRLVASDGAANDYFGGALWYNTFVTPVAPVYYATPGEAATNSAGTRAVIGAPGHAIGSQLGAGSAYVYEGTNDTWHQTTALTATGPAAYDGFGWSVAMTGDGNTLAVGAPYRSTADNPRQGFVYVFHATDNGWTLGAELTQSDGHTDDNYGWSVAFSRDGNTLIVGAPGYRVLDNPDRSGAAFVYNREGDDWTLAHQLVPPKTIIGAAFGTSTALSKNGKTALVTSADSIDANKVHHQGMSDVFTTSDNWHHEKHRVTLTDPNVNADGTGDDYGVSTSLSDDGRIAAIAAPGVDVDGLTAAGSVYIAQSTNSTWSDLVTTTQLKSPAPARFDAYGSAVAFSANGASLVVGVDGAGENDQGVVYRATAQSSFLPRWRGGVEQQLVPAPVVDPGSFGTAVAANENASIIVATSPLRTIDGAANRGEAYVVSARGWG